MATANGADTTTIQIMRDEDIDAQYQNPLDGMANLPALRRAPWRGRPITAKRYIG
jgi:hypothetical protein